MDFGAPSIGSGERKLAVAAPKFRIFAKSGIKALLAESLATAVTCFLVTGAYLNARQGNTTADALAAAITTGLAYAGVTHAFCQISGAHLNPALTVSFLAARLIRVNQAFAYIVAQVVGSIAGTAALYAVTTRDAGIKLGATIKGSDTSYGEAFGMEFILGFILALYVMATLDPDNRKGHLRYAGGIYVGMAYAALTYVGFPWSNASLNPARSFGAAVIADEWDSHWVYWLGPIVGAMLGSLTYVIFFNWGRPVQAPRVAFNNEDLAFSPGPALASSGVLEHRM